MNCSNCNSPEISKFDEITDFFLTNEVFFIYSCNNCGVKFTHPIPENLTPYYNSEEYLSHEKNNKSIFSFVYNTIKSYSISRKYLGISKKMKRGSVLEIGCGTGDLLNIFNKSKWKTIGVEPNDKPRNYAINHFNLNIVNNIEEIKNENFNVIMLWHVLEHVINLKKYIHFLNEKLDKNGLLVIALPNPESWDAKHYKKYWAGWDVPRHLYHINEKALKELTKEYFVIKEKQPLVFDSFYISMLSEKYKGKKGLNLLFSFIYNGLKSNINAWKTNEFSSMIYYLKKK